MKSILQHCYRIPLVFGLVIFAAMGGRLDAVETCEIPGLISWWSAERGAEDALQLNPGVLKQGAGLVPGVQGQGFGFDGRSAYFESSSSGFPVGSADRTLEMWVYIRSYSTLEQSVFAGYGAFGSFKAAIDLGTFEDRRLFVSQWGDALFGPPLKTKTWYHVAVTIENSWFTLYLNGVAVGEKSMRVETAVDTPFYIGRLPLGFENRYRLDGIVDEVGVYSRSLSADEIMGIFQAGTLGRCPGPRFTADPEHLRLARGANVTLISSIIGAEPIHFQWRKGGLVLPGADNPTLALNGVRPDDVGEYSVDATNAFGAASRLVATVSLLPLVIESNPAPQRIFEGGSAELRVQACCDSLQYQWFFNRQPLSEATNTTLHIPAVNLSDSGSYWVIVSNVYGAATSRVAALSVGTRVGLGEALGAPQLRWTSGGAASWFPQVAHRHAAGHAAQSGRIDHLQTSWLRTVLTGPGVLTFWWKGSSEPGYDFLILLIDQTEVPWLTLTGEADWQRVVIRLDPGEHQVSWEYRKDLSSNEGADSGWVADVRFLVPGEMDAVKLIGEEVELTFATQSGVNYWVEAAPKLTGPWSALVGPLFGSGWIDAIRNSRPSASTQWYRVRSDGGLLTGKPDGR